MPIIAAVFACLTRLGKTKTAHHAVYNSSVTNGALPITGALATSDYDCTKLCFYMQDMY